MDSIIDDIELLKTEQISLYGEDVKMVRQHKLNSVLLTPAEKDEAVVKYEYGMTMTAVADLYDCHYTTVGRLLRQRGIEIRE